LFILQDTLFSMKTTEGAPMNYPSFFRIALLVCLLFLLIASLSFAAETGKITGKVTLSDTGDPAPGATVQLTDMNSDAKTGTKTDVDGVYTINNVPPGIYKLRFSCVGYGAITIDSVIVTAGTTFTQNASLKPSAIQSSEISVTAEKPKAALKASGKAATSPSTESDIRSSVQSDLTSILSTRPDVKIDREGQIHVRGGRSAEAFVEPNSNAPGFQKPQPDWRYNPPPKPPHYYPQPPQNEETYQHVRENHFMNVSEEPLSTFSIDVDAASYSNVRRFLTEGRMPPQDAVRVEEMINYFPYEYPTPSSDKPCSITTNLTECPWDMSHYLLRIGLKAREISSRKSPPNNLVFLLDVSGSMASENKLPLVKRAFRMLVEQMRPKDRIAIVTYAGHTGVALQSTSGLYKDQIYSLIESLHAGGSTAGGEGIQLAYRVAQDNFIEDGNNRVILATDGDFNVGISNDDDLVRMIEQKRQTGVFLTVLGFGEGNLKDAKMEKLADKGNGQYHYIDNILEARKVFVNELEGTLVTVAKDVKVQVEFNPSQVQAYRLIGYENRMLAAQDFNNDRKDAGEMGAGHTVTALYELVPAGGNPRPDIDPLRYQPSKEPDEPVVNNDEWLYVKVRYKEPTEDNSKLVTKPVSGTPQTLERLRTHS